MIYLHDLKARSSIVKSIELDSLPSVLDIYYYKFGTEVGIEDKVQKETLVFSPLSQL
jgi:hypothetical protein